MSKTTDNGQALPVKPEWFMPRIVEAYTECAVWVSLGDDGEPLDQSDAELSEQAKQQFAEDCANFVAYCDETLGEDWHADLSLGQIGHDFWLTRNGHGAGFWDRGLGELGRKLSDAAKTFGSCGLYIGDDGEIYAS